MQLIASGWIRRKDILVDLVSAIIESRDGKIDRILLEQNGVFSRLHPIQVRSLLKAKGKAKRVVVLESKVFVVER